jgi:hypothetical protein
LSYIHQQGESLMVTVVAQHVDALGN